MRIADHCGSPASRAASRATGPNTGNYLDSRGADGSATVAADKAILCASVTIGVQVVDRGAGRRGPAIAPTGLGQPRGQEIERVSSAPTGHVRGRRWRPSLGVLGQLWTTRLRPLGPYQASSSVTVWRWRLRMMSAIGP